MNQAKPVANDKDHAYYFQRKGSENARLDISAPAFVPNTRRPLNQSEDVSNRSINDLLNMMKRNELRANINALNLDYNQIHSLPTPPNSTSPLWSSHSPIVPSNVHFRQSSQTIPAANLGLNLLTPAARSFDELAEQINRLNIQQQKNLEELARLNASAQTMSALPHRNEARSGLPAHHLDPTPAIPKPEMPISLPDLVAQHTPGHTPEIRGSKLIPAALLGDPVKIIEVSKNRNPGVVIHAVSAATVGRKGNEAYADKELGHPRQSRSVPFSRFHDKLASVPEEADSADDECTRRESSLQQAPTTFPNAFPKTTRGQEGRTLPADRSGSKAPQHLPSLSSANKQSVCHKMNPQAKSSSPGAGKDAPSEVEHNNNMGTKQWKKAAPSAKGNGRYQAKAGTETHQPTKASKKAATKSRRK